MLDYQDATNVDSKTGMPFTVRSVFMIDPTNKIRAMITYPASTGRNFNEILRVVDSLQLSDSKRICTPANWNPGDDVIIPPSMDAANASLLFPGHSEIKPYLRFTKL